MNKRLNLSLFFLFILMSTLHAPLKIHAQSQTQVVYNDESGRQYMNYKTNYFRYKHPQQMRYYSKVWWQPDVPGCRNDAYCVVPPLRYYRNGWPYYWFY